MVAFQESASESRAYLKLSPCINVGCHPKRQHLRMSRPLIIIILVLRPERVCGGDECDSLPAGPRRDRSQINHLHLARFIQVLPLPLPLTRRRKVNLTTSVSDRRIDLFFPRPFSSHLVVFFSAGGIWARARARAMWRNQSSRQSFFDSVIHTDHLCWGCPVPMPDVMLVKRKK